MKRLLFQADTFYYSTYVLFNSQPEAVSEGDYIPGAPENSNNAYNQAVIDGGNP
jgi:hypothetical protein